ncbi:MAG: class I SAM-dependent methyltransferase [Acidobacteriota bacterium]
MNAAEVVVMEHESLIHAEGQRIKSEYLRRDLEIDHDLYAPWQPGEMLMTGERKRIAAAMLSAIQKFPVAGQRFLEVGYGRIGWLGDALSWGLRTTDLYGMELDAQRASHAQLAFPGAHLEVGDATKLPWADDHFDYAVISTVFSSVLSERVRTLIADELARVVRSDGAVILYDIAVNNPRNKSVRRLTRSEVRSMFPGFSCQFRSATLAPPIARLVAKRSWGLANVLSGIPFLRTHFVGVLVKP